MSAKAENHHMLGVINMQAEETNCALGRKLRGKIVVSKKLF